MNVDLIVATSIFIIFVSAVFIYLFVFQKQASSWQTLIELRKKTAELTKEFVGKGNPENWEKENIIPSKVGIASTAFSIPILISDHSGVNRLNEPIAIEIYFDEECKNIAWNESIRIYDENLNEIPYKFLNQTFCFSNFLQKAILFFEINVSANSSRRLQIFFHNSTSVKSKNYGNFSSLVLWLKFDEGYGSIAYDYSGNNNIGILYNGTNVCSNPPTSSCPSWIDGKVGKAISFDGINDYISVSNFEGNFSQLSIEVSIYPKSYENYKKIVDFGLNSSSGRRFTLQLALDGISMELDDGTSGYVKWASAPLNQWLHLVGVWSGSSFIRLYVNGEMKAENTTLPNITSCSILSTDLHMIGRGIGAEHYFNGTIDEVRIYNRVLSIEEIISRYQQPLLIKTFPRQKVDLISFEKVDSLKNINYDLLREILHEGYNFRVEIYEK